MKHRTLIPLGTALMLLIGLAQAAPVKAQPDLISADPAPDSVLVVAPDSIILTFNLALDDQGTSIQVTDDSGKRYDDNLTVVDPANRFHASVKVNGLIEGKYTVTYMAAAVGSSTVTIGSYIFALDLPDPTLQLVEPVNGQAYHFDEFVQLKMRTENFDFALYNDRIRIYVDGEIQDEVRTRNHNLAGLQPGVHQIKVVLAQFEDQEVADTAITVTIAIAQPDSEPASSADIPAAESDLKLSSLQIVGVAVFTALLLAVGIWLGRRTDQMS